MAKSAGIGAVTAAIGGLAAVALVRRFPRNWWAPAAVLVIAYGVVTIWLYPIVIDPLFNRFEKLQPGQLRSDVMQLAERAGVDVGEVYRVDASRRTSAANAYVIGLGHSKRVVLYDNLIENFPRDEVRLVVAHELGHQKHDDLLRGLAWLALVAPAGTFLTQALAERFGRRERLGDPRARPGPSALPAIALAIALAGFALGAASNALSRPVEAAADSFALELTRDPGNFVKFERRITIRNVGDPDPPKLVHLLFDTHPTTLERIGFGVAWRRAALASRLPRARVPSRPHRAGRPRARRLRAPVRVGGRAPRGGVARGRARGGGLPRGEGGGGARARRLLVAARPPERGVRAGRAARPPPGRARGRGGGGRGVRRRERRAALVSPPHAAAAPDLERAWPR